MLKFDERAVFSLRGLYEQYGYSQYKMSKFEEYELYVRNKDFLISDSIITFTDADGRLMALKPDVTLSIIKNSRFGEGTVQKVYYNENVYRAAKGSRSFKEIMQVGLECIGAIDDYCIGEVLLLAARSLCSISEKCILDISHLGILSELMEKCEVPAHLHKTVLKFISEKNLHELSHVCAAEGVSEQNIQLLRAITNVYGTPEQSLKRLHELTDGLLCSDALCELERVLSWLVEEGFGDMLRIDFSVVNDISYYNGIVFKGFIEGIPTSVLSGGQYDRLLRKLHRNAGAIGFAVYLDLLERMGEDEEHYDADVLLLYGENDGMRELHSAVKTLQEQGKRVMVQKNQPEKLKFKSIYRLNGNGVAELEDHA